MHIKQTNIKDLLIKCNTKYHMTIKKIYKTCMLIYIDNKSYMISIPKNDTWYDVSIYEGFKCMVSKYEYYSNNKKYAKLEYIKSTPKTYLRNKSINTSSTYYHDLDSGNSMSAWIQQANLTGGWK